MVLFRSRLRGEILRLGFSLAVVVGGLAGAARAAPPRVLDPRLKIERVADSNQIVTPTGIACDRRGRVLVVECHTHMRPVDYQGPPADRIRRMEDTNGDGRFDRVTTFYEGSLATMGIAFAHDGSLLVATRSEIFRLRDTDRDGAADERTELARLETAETYPHNGLSGFAQDFAGTIFFGLGENLSVDYRLVARDGTVLSGGGEGGNLYRIDGDGTGLERVATGFWNPFGQACDALGHLFAADNDPDWRPPCRLLHIVPGGDYGYRRRYGRKGIHPFCAWFGELPGTLGMIAATGEAPCGVLPYDSDGLPADYRGDLLTTSWGDHAIQRFALRRRGASFQSVAQTLVQGDADFRPVGIALARDGSVLLTDWVDRSYPLHGKGRIWRICRREAGPSPSRPADPRRAIDSLHRPLREWAARRLLAAGEPGRRRLVQRLANGDRSVRATALAALLSRGEVDSHLAADVLADPDPALRALAVERLPAERLDAAGLAENDPDAAVRAAALRRIDDRHDRPVLLRALGDDDPFLRQAAREALHGQVGAAELAALLPSASGLRRSEIALLLRRAGGPIARRCIPALLADGDPRVRFVGIAWVGEARLASFRGDLLRTLHAKDLSGPLLSAVLAALDLLDHADDPTQFEARQTEIIGQLLARGNLAPSVTARALRLLPADHPALSPERFGGLLADPDPTVRLEAVRTLRASPSQGWCAVLLRMARDRAVAAPLRAEAVAGLDPNDPAARRALVELAINGTGPVPRAALQSLRGSRLSEMQRDVLVRLADRRPDLADAVGRVTDPDWRPSGRPPRDKPDDWLAWLAKRPGDRQAGARLFFHPRGPGCATCHAYDGRGEAVGPDLAAVHTMAPRRLIASLLEPSRDIAPRYVPWSLVTADGKVFSGLLVGVDRDGREVYVDAQRRRMHVAPEEIDVRKQLAVSIMPEGLLDRLTDQEVRDLFALLSTPPSGRVEGAAQNDARRLPRPVTRPSASSLPAGSDR